MNLNDKLSNTVLEKLAERLPGEPVRFCLQSDLNLRQHYGESYKS